MVEYTLQLDSVFHSLADPIRRDILLRIKRRELSIGELAQKYDVSFAAISKHLKVLEKARLVSKRRDGKKYMVSLVPQTFKDADDYLEQYRLMWEERFDKLDALLKESQRSEYGQD